MENPPPVSTLSIIIPVYNEAGTIGVVLSHVVEVLPAAEKEIVIIDDRATDGPPPMAAGKPRRPNGILAGVDRRRTSQSCPSAGAKAEHVLPFAGVAAAIAAARIGPLEITATTVALTLINNASDSP